MIVIWKRVNKDKLFKRTGVNVLVADRTVHSPQLMDTVRKKTLRYLWPVGTHSDKSVLPINLQHVPVLSIPHPFMLQHLLSSRPSQASYENPQNREKEILLSHPSYI